MLKTLIFITRQWLATPKKQAALKSITITLCSIFLSFICYSQPNQAAGKKQIDIRFINTVDSQVLELRNMYQNTFGEDYTIRNFKYYISRISLHKTDGKVIAFKGHHLINEADSMTKKITVSTSEKNFKSISFLIGVDSIYNVSGTQTGGLDPAKGMFWTWNSGYVMAKLEASSPLSHEPNNNVTLHVGGFKTGENTARLITLDLQQIHGASDPGKAINEIVISANANKWFDAVHTLKIADVPLCTTPGKLAVQFADNYAQMFTIASVN